MRCPSPLFYVSKAASHLKTHCSIVLLPPHALLPRISSASAFQNFKTYWQYKPYYMQRENQSHFCLPFPITTALVLWLNYFILLRFFLFCFPAAPAFASTLLTGGPDRVLWSWTGAGGPKDSFFFFGEIIWNLPWRKTCRQCWKSKISAQNIYDRLSTSFVGA